MKLDIFVGAIALNLLGLPYARRTKSFTGLVLHLLEGVKTVKDN